MYIFYCNWTEVLYFIMKYKVMMMTCFILILLQRRLAVLMYITFKAQFPQNCRYQQSCIHKLAKNIYIHNSVLFTTIPGLGLIPAIHLLIVYLTFV